MKPPPRPYKTMHAVDDIGATAGISVVTVGERETVLATFWRQNSLRQARANAEAWIAGMAALEGIERLRKARENYGRNVIPTDAEHKELMDAISALLGPKE